jgi:hypothetical protein
MIKKYNKIISLILIVIIFSFTIIFFISPKKNFSIEENRNLQPIPKFKLSLVFSGVYIGNLSNYIIDHFPFRSTFMNMQTKISKMSGKNDINEIYFSDNDYLIQKYDKSHHNNKIINTLNEFNKSVNYVNTNLILVPTSISINNRLLPNNAPTYSEISSINYIYNKIHFDTINIYDTLLKHNKDYQMFYRLDNHWTSFGAYYAYVEYAKANNLKAYSLNSFDIKEVSNDYKGSLYTKTADYNAGPDSMHIFSLPNTNYTVEYIYEEKQADSLYKTEFLKGRDKYSYFLGSTNSLIVITNNQISTDKELIVIGDSYSNSIIPFLVNHYKKVHVIDPMYYRGSVSKYVLSNKSITDCLIIYNINEIDKQKSIFLIK